MTFEERIQTLRAEKSRTSFSFHFIDLYSEEEWMNMSVKQRTRRERIYSTIGPNSTCKNAIL